MTATAMRVVNAVPFVVDAAPGPAQLARPTGHRSEGGLLLTERDESYGAGLAELMNPEVARNPQPIYSMLQTSTPVFRLDGVGVIVTSRSGVDAVLRDPETFSSSTMAHDLKAKRPLIPLQIDPPDHRKYRKLLDPLFAPQRMKLLEDSTSQLVNDLIDGFVDEPEIDFSARFSTPFPSQVFLTLFGLPMEELPRFLKMKDGAIRPDQVVGHEFGHPETEAYQQQTADSIYAYFEAVIDERAGDVREDLLSHFLHAEVDGDRLTHEEILDICFLFLIAGLDTVTASLDCFFGYLVQHPDARRRIVEEPDAIPAMVEELLRWETPVMGTARVATARHRDRGLRHQRGRAGDGRCSVPPTSTRPSSPTPASSSGIAKPTGTWPSAAGSTAASARTWPASSSAWRCGSGTAGSPTTASSPVSSSTTRPASAPSTASRCSSATRREGLTRHDRLSRGCEAVLRVRSRL